MRKTYVPVVVRIDEAGYSVPQIIEFDGRRYQVERVIDVCRTVCKAVGTLAVCYTCLISGRPTELWEEKGCWFVIAK